MNDIWLGNITTLRRKQETIIAMYTYHSVINMGKKMISFNLCDLTHSFLGEDLLVHKCIF